MAIIVGLSDREFSYNSVEITQISCFLLVAEQGFGPGSVGCNGTEPGPQKQKQSQKQLLSV